jgi:hypothetical protein
LRRVVVGAACVAAASPLVLTGGPAGAAPLEFAKDQKLDAVCFTLGVEVKELGGLIPVPGNGFWTPYKAGNGQVFVPRSFTLTSAAAGLKSRHLNGVLETVSKAGPPGSTTCHVSGPALGIDGTAVPFTATIVGNLVGNPNPPTP